jgi:hypothetical protein
MPFHRSGVSELATARWQGGSNGDQSFARRLSGNSTRVAGLTVSLQGSFDIPEEPGLGTAAGRAVGDRADFESDHIIGPAKLTRLGWRRARKSGNARHVRTNWRNMFMNFFR